MNIVFVDAKCRSLYDTNVMRTEALGGTEATVVRIANGLSLHHSVKVVQHNREVAREESPSLQFLPLANLSDVIKNAHHIFFIQKAQYIDKIALATRARLWLWLHNYLGDEVPFYWADHLRYRLGIICVSKTHASHTRRHLRSLPAYWASLGTLGRGGLLYHYNPLDHSLHSTAPAKRDMNKLIFFSSPHKGIEHVISLFGEVYKKNNKLRLFVADPGYMKENHIDGLDNPGIVNLGKLPQHEILNHVREALCVFYPQRKRPETFGLVYAESNAVGTPVLAHDFGSAAEVLVEGNPPLDASQSQVVINTLLDWSTNGGPVVQANPSFKIALIIDNWNKFLFNPKQFIQEQTF